MASRSDGEDLADLHPNSCLRRDPARERLFAAKLVKNGFDRVQAVIDAGITSNRNSAHVIGYRLLRRVTTQEAIKKHMETAKMSADEVLEKLTKVARADADFKGSDVVKAAELLGKGHRLWVDKVESTDTTERDGLAQALLKSIESASKKDQVSPERAVIELYEALPEYPELENWPEKYRGAISAYLAERNEVSEVTEIGDQ